MSGDLAAWLLQQVEADEAAENRKVRWEAERWTCARCGRPIGELDFSDGAMVLPCGHKLTPEEKARTLGEVSDADPFRLAECDIKRRIVERARDYVPELEHGDSGEWAFEAVLRLLAVPYADRPGYREEWRPPTEARNGAS